MAKFNITAPDGQKYEVNAPEGATEQDAIQYVQNNLHSSKSAEPENSQSLKTKALTYAGKYLVDKSNMGLGALRGLAGVGSVIAHPFEYAYDKIAGNTESTHEKNIARMEANYKSVANTESPEFKGGKIAAEIGVTMPLGGLLGQGAKYLGAPRLGNAITSGGFNLGSPAAKALSIQGLKNAATRLAGGGINAGASTYLTTGNVDDALTGAGIGMAIPAVGKIAGTVGSASSKAVKGAIAPFTKSGRSNILADNLVEMLGDKAPDVARNLALAKGNVAGFTPSAGQAAKSAELAAFERAFKNKNAGLFQDFKASQNTALANAARGLGGDDLTRIGLEDARSAAAKPYYDAGQMAEIEATKELESLLGRPIINQARKAAEVNAINSGENFAANSIISGNIYDEGAPDLVTNFTRQDLMKGEKLSGGQGKNLVQKIKQLGGINLNQIRDITGERTGRAARAQVGLFHRGGLGVDDLAGQLDSAGYIPPEEMAADGGVQYVKDMVKEHLGGNKTFAMDDVPMYAPNYMGEKTTELVNSRNINGAPIINKVYSGKELQQIKFALDAAKKYNPMASTGERMTQGSVMQASDDFNKYLGQVSPDLRKGDAVYREMSAPINQLDIGNEIASRYIPSKYLDSASPLEFKANSTEMLSKIANNTGGAGDALARKVTGFSGATLNNTLSSKQKALLDSLVKDNLQIDAGATLGRELGSPTYQHLAYNAKGEEAGLLSGLLGATKTGRILGSIRDFAYSKPLQKLDNDLAVMLQNPNTTGAQIEARLAKLDNSKRTKIMELIGQSAAKSVPVGLLSQ